MELSDVLYSFIGVGVSLAFSYIPGLNDWFYMKVDPKYRGLFMVLLALICTAGVFGLSCISFLDTVTCTSAGALTLLKAFFFLLVSNQITYKLSSESPAKARLREKYTQYTEYRGLLEGVEPTEHEC